MHSIRLTSEDYFYWDNIWLYFEWTKPLTILERRKIPNHLWSPFLFNLKMDLYFKSASKGHWKINQSVIPPLVEILHRCWWRMLKTRYVGDKLRCQWPIQHVNDRFHTLRKHHHYENSRQHNDSVINIWNQSPA